MKSVAGTEVYQDRKEKAMRELHATDITLQAINESLEGTRARIKELEGEKNCLEEFKRLDLNRRGLEYAINERDLAEVVDRLEEVQESLKVSLKVNATLELEKLDVERKAKSLELESFKNEENNIVQEVNLLEAKFEGITKKNEDLKLKLTDLREVLNMSQSQEADTVAAVAEEVDRQEKNAKVLEGRFIKASSELNLAKEKLVSLEHERDRKYAKLGRKNHFTSKEERNVWIDNEVLKICHQVESKELQINDLKESLLKSENQLNEDNDQLALNETKLKEIAEVLTDLSNQLQEKLNEKAEQGRSVSKLSEQINSSNLELSKTKDALLLQQNKLGTIGGLRPILIGNESIRKVLPDREDLAEHYHGMTIDLFSCPEAMFSAVDETAGNKLFYHVVNSDVIATEIMKEVNRRRLPGLISFLPLNRLINRVCDFSRVNQEAAIPLKIKLEYNDYYEKVIDNLFGRTLVCRDVDTMVELAREINCDCVTLNGDKGSSKGVLSGGYINKDKSKMKNFSRLRELNVEKDQHSEGLKILESEMVRTASTLDKIAGNINTEKVRLDKAESDQGRLSSECTALRKIIFESKETLRSLREKTTTLSQELGLLKETKTGLQAEKEEEMNSQLATQEKNDLEKLASAIEDQKKIFKQIANDKSDIERGKNCAEDELKNLQSQLTKLKNDEFLQSKNAREFEIIKVEYDNERKVKEEIKFKLAELKKSEESLTKTKQNISFEVKEIEDKISNLKSQKAEQFTVKQKLYERIARIEESKKLFLEKRENIGGIPKDSRERYSGKSRKVLGKDLEEVLQMLKQFANVNKKAFEQYQTFTQEEESFGERLLELRKEKKKILDMIRVLDERKNDQILYTFLQIQKYFKEVFSDIVPNGSADMLLTGPESSQSRLAEKLQAASGKDLAIFMPLNPLCTGGG